MQFCDWCWIEHWDVDSGFRAAECDALKQGANGHHHVQRRDQCLRDKERVDAIGDDLVQDGDAQVAPDSLHKHRGDERLPHPEVCGQLHRPSGCHGAQGVWWRHLQAQTLVGHVVSYHAAIQHW